MISARTAGGWCGELIGSSFKALPSPGRRPARRSSVPIVGLALLLCAASIVLTRQAHADHLSSADAPLSTTFANQAPPVLAQTTLAQSTLAQVTLAQVTLAQVTLAQTPKAPTASTQAGTAPATASRSIPKMSAGEWLAVVNIVSAPIILALLWAGNVIRPGSLEGGRDVKAHPWWVWLFASLVVWMSLQAGAGAMMNLKSVVGPDTQSMRYSGTTQLAGYLLGLVSAVAMARLLTAGGGAGSGIGFRPKDAPLGIACLLLAFPILEVVSRGATYAASKINGSAPSELAHNALKQMVEGRNDPWVYAMGFNAIILAPIVEEVIYRGFLQSALLRLSGRAWPAIFVTSALFAAAHYGAVPPHALANLFVLSIAMGVAFERTRSLGVSILMHVGFNAANVAIGLWLH